MGKNPNPPEVIITQFREKWAGTGEELASALEALYIDLADSFNKAMTQEGVEHLTRMLAIDTVEDYFVNHYGEDNIPT